MRGDGMMLTDAQRRDFLALLFDWLNQEPRGVGPGPQPRPDDYAFTLYAKGHETIGAFGAILSFSSTRLGDMTETFVSTS